MRALRVLHVGPLPPSPSGVADYAAELLPHLAERVDLVAAIADDAPPPLACPIPWLRISALETRTPAPFDSVIYQIGNHRMHARMIDLMREWSGVVVLHDAVLHHMWADRFLARGRAGAYVREAAVDGGQPRLARALEAVFGRARPAWDEQPMLRRVVWSARGLIVHSRSARASVLSAEPRARVAVIPMGVDPPPAIFPDRSAVRANYGLSRDTFVVGTFGGLTHEKRIDVVVEAFAALRRARPDARLLLVGAPSPGLDVPGLLSAHGVQDTAIAPGRVDLEQFERLLAATDLCIQLRWPTTGETSSVVLRALRLGRPTVVSRVGWYGELPATVVAHVPPDAGTVEALADLLIRLAGDDGERARLSAAGSAFAMAHPWTATADSYVDFLTRLGRAQNDRLPGHLLAV